MLPSACTGDTVPPKKVKEEATSSETAPVLMTGEKVWQAYLQLQAEHEKLKKELESQEHIIETYEEATVDVKPTGNLITYTVYCRCKIY